MSIENNFDRYGSKTKKVSGWCTHDGNIIIAFPYRFQVPDTFEYLMITTT